MEFLYADGDQYVFMHPVTYEQTTLTKELFIPRFQERDEGEREKPSAKYPWDGVSGVRPYRGFAATTVVGVY